MPSWGKVIAWSVGSTGKSERIGDGNKNKYVLCGWYRKGY
jgi:hypothetical protein